MERREQLVRIVEAVHSPAYTAEENCARIDKIFKHVVKLESEVDKASEPEHAPSPLPPVQTKSDKHKR